MAKLTLLAMVQNILSDINSDEVASISDTVEATQVAETIKSVYFDILADTDIPEHFSIKQLDGVGDVDTPTYLNIPTGVDKIQWVKYNIQDTTKNTSITYATMPFMQPEEFLNRVLTLDSAESNVQTVTTDTGISLLIRNDKMPEFYTSFDDDTLVFDSFDSAEQSTLTASRTLIYCSTEPAWSASDTFVPDLDSNLFPLLLAEAKSLVFINNTQASNPKVEQIAKRHQARKQGRKHKTKDAGLNPTPDYGRRR